MARPFIAAYKAGETSVDKYISHEKVIYWYRPTLKHVQCDSTDTTMRRDTSNASRNFSQGRPNGYHTMADQIFIISLLTSPGTIQVDSGNTTAFFEAPAGDSAFTVPMSVGKQKFTLLRDSKTIMSSVSLKEVQSTCICGIYNFNAYVGTVPPRLVNNQLGPSGLSKLTVGLNVPCPTNTLGPTEDNAPLMKLPDALGRPRSQRLLHYLHPSMKSPPMGVAYRDIQHRTIRV
jgi:hypothetical protein